MKDEVIMLSDVKMEEAREDSKAERKYKAQRLLEEEIKKWLQSNPEVGVLSNGKFYRIENGIAVDVKPLEKLA